MTNDLQIENAEPGGKAAWNEFVREHYPPVGGFMQAWEWGEFQKKLGRAVNRYFVTDAGAPAAAFTLIHQALPMGVGYGYAARGPVIAGSHKDRLGQICEAACGWARQELPGFAFLRLEPPVAAVPGGLAANGFRTPGYYIQPRYNLTVPLAGTEEDILMSFHSSTRSNVRRAEKRGVSVEIRGDVSPEEYLSFTSMMRDTIQRNSGTNAYPSEAYFKALFETLAHSGSAETGNLSLMAFYGRQNGEPAATHFVLFFGGTATYLYGAAHTKHLRSKVTTYLHWAAMLEAKRRGMEYYDLGGIDEKLWPKLTDFKRQFRGKEFEYIGNIDAPFRPLAYRAYNLLRRLKK